MNAHLYPGQHEKVISGAGAFGMHLLLLALLVFGVNWQKKVEPQVNIVDLWTNLPSQVKPKVEPPPPPPEPVVKPEPKPVEPTPVKVAPKPEVAKPDIAMKKKAEKEKAETEKAEKDRRLLKEKQIAARKREEEAKAVQKERQAKEAEEQLDEFVERLKADNKNVFIEIQGHTDSTGSSEYNMRLGQERADAVRRYLNQKGVALNRLSTISYGETQPVDSNKTKGGRYKNRRVVIVVLS